jgi:putative FmdB family regulatory protein
MPIYEYSCKACGHEFEALIRGQKTPACPSCESEELERLLSLPRIKSEGTRDLAMRAAKKRDAKQATERMHTQLQYEQSHDRHG